MEYDTPSITKENDQSDPLAIKNEPYELFNLALPDDKLIRMVVNSLTASVNHWENKPWQLKKTDTQNTQYFLGEQISDTMLLPHSVKYVNNRLFSTTRAILAYITNQLAKPEIIPSKGGEKEKRIARQMQDAIYQHAMNNYVNTKFRMAVKNLIVRKRGVLKLRFDPDAGPFGDIVTESIDPSDIVIDRYARFGEDPNIIYQKQRCTIEELVAKFPDKQKEIYSFYGFKRGVATQLSRIVTYYECWFSYWDSNKKKQGLCWFIPDSTIILGKMDNPNWIDTGDLTKSKIVNLSAAPIKPYVWLNYINTGRSFIDETSIFDQAMPQQDLLNKRGRQIWENADYANPRVLVNGSLMEQSDADKFVNKNPKTIALLNKMEPEANINNAVTQISATMLPSYVVETLYDARNEIDKMMGVNNIFTGEQPKQSSQTLGQDMLLKQQATAMQDDLLNVVNTSMGTYYTMLLQMMKVYLPDDYWILTKGQTGEYNSIMMNSDKIDSNVKVSVQPDSTLPLDKESQRQAAIELAKLPGRIDDLSLFEMLGLPDPDKLAERVQRFNIDRYTYMQSIEQGLFDAEADADIEILIKGTKIPEDRDDYSEDYLNHFNLFLTKNRFAKLAPEVQQRITDFLHQVANKAATTEALKDSMLNPAGIIDRPPIFPLPKREIRFNMKGDVDPQSAALMGQQGTNPVPANSQSQNPPQPQAANPAQPGGPPVK